MKTPRLLLLAALASAALSAGCRNDPAVQQIIDGLGPETGPVDATHRPGQPCLACHTAYGGATPLMAVAGTVYGLSASGKAVVPARNIRVILHDSSGSNGQPGVQRAACSNSAGNFYVLASDWADPPPTFPLSPKVGVTATSAGVGMVSLINREGSCASCHVLPALQQQADVINPITGAGHASAGVIIVDPTATDPTCEASQ